MYISPNFTQSTESMRKAIYIFFLWIFSLFHLMSQINEIEQLIEEVQRKYAPDQRVEIFSVKASRDASTLQLIGKTTSEAAYLALMREARKISPQIKESILLLPDKALGEENLGVIYNSVGTLRAEPRYGSELVSQVLLGMPVKILERQGGWLRIQTPDRYIGWISGSVKQMSQMQMQQYLKQPKVVVTALSASSFANTGIESLPVSDLVAGNMLVLQSVEVSCYRVQYPDGREAYVQKTDAVEVSEWVKDIKLNGENVVNTAFRFMGIPYLWGGTSAKGLDCSGFTKLVYFLHGIILARDASQQVFYGKLVDETGHFDEVQPGDLLFFGTKATIESPLERVVHVGIYIGNKRFIHASDYVHINSFDPADPLYDEFNAHRYLRAKRVIGEVNNEGIEELLKNSFYQSYQQ